MDQSANRLCWGVLLWREEIHVFNTHISCQADLFASYHQALTHTAGLQASVNAIQDSVSSLRIKAYLMAARSSLHINMITPVLNDTVRTLTISAGYRNEGVTVWRTKCDRATQMNIAFMLL